MLPNKFKTYKKYCDKIFLMLLLLPIAIPSSIDAQSFEIPIYRKRLVIRSSSEMATEHERNNNDNLFDKNPIINRKISNNTWDNDTISLNKFMDGEYYGVIRIGNPAREFKMSFDTTWADSWVPSEHCGLWEIACMIHTKYDGSKSSTYQMDGRPFQTGDTSNDLKGYISMDSFNLAHLTVKNQSFAEITHMPWLPYGWSKADGIIGLGFSALRRLPVPTFFNNMLKQGLINKPIFTFYFNRDQSTERAGRVILGATERKHVNGSLTAVPVIEKMYWKIKMDRVTINEKSHRKTYTFCQDSCETILDTSTNTITGPTDEIDRMNELLGARAFVPAFFKMQRYMVNCRDFAKLPPITFVIAGEDFEIKSKYYIQHLVYESMEVCLSPFVPSDQKFWQLGGAFLMQFYTEYNFNTAQVMIGKTKF